jgi:hypothetical protein
MSFVLPRNQRLIEWTGEVRALGRGRPKQDEPSRPPPSSKRDVYQQAEMLPTPCIGSQSPFRAAYPSFDDRAETQAMDREDIFGSAPPKPMRHGLPVPNFRAAIDPPGPQIVYLPKPVVRKKPTSLFTLMVWTFAAIIAGMIAFRFAPQAMEHVDEAVKALDR